MRPTRSPQEKKRLSLERDGRNQYGENDKASRKNIPRAKARVNRANRRAEAEALGAATGTSESAVAEQAALTPAATRPKRWRKSPDHRLGKVLERKRNPSETNVNWETQHLR